MKNTSKKAEIYVVCVNGIPLGGFTYLKGACELGAVSYDSAVAGKMDWIREDSALVRIRRVPVKKVSGRGGYFKKK